MQQVGNSLYLEWAQKAGVKWRPQPAAPSKDLKHTR